MKNIAAVLSAFFLGITIISVTPFEAAAQQRTLVDLLFPEVAERKRARQAAERKRQLEIKRAEQRRLAAQNKPKKVKAPVFKNYQPSALRPVNLAALASAFASAQMSTRAAEALEDAAQLQRHLIDERRSLDAFAALPRAERLQPLRLASIGEAVGEIEVRARSALGEALVAHYSKAPRFMWVDEDGRPNNAARAVLALFEQADRHALEPQDYAVEPITNQGDPLDLARFELELTARALRYFADARHGIVTPDRISGYHDFAANKPRFDILMGDLSGAENPAEMLASAHPKDPAYQALVAEIAELEGEKSDLPPIDIPARIFVKPGVTHEEIADVVEAARRLASPELLSAHEAVFAADHGEGLYSPEVVAMVRDIQKQLKLKPDGIVGPRTVARLLPDGPHKKLAKLRYAVERLRWHPDSLGPDHVFINQPAYRAKLIRGGVERVAMNVVVGKPSNQTYFFHDEIEYVEFNPYWGIPRSILVNEMLPKLRNNPGYFDNLGYEMKDRRGRQISSSSVDWWNVGTNFPFDVRQPPGPRNALGTLKIMFPNSHAIYMHDTPAKSLFSRRTRAFSHGCVRLEDPHLMAAAVLQTSRGDVKAEIADGRNKRRNLSRKLPVYVAYFTAWPNAAGTVEYHADVYGRDGALQKAIEKEREARRSAETG